MTTNQEINRIADELYGKQSTAAANYYIGLLTATPNPDGTNVQEVSITGTGYARRQLPNNKTTFSTSNNGQVSNVSEIDFPAATAAWGTITDVGIFDAATGGNLLYSSTQATPKAYDTGDIAFFAAGDVKWTVQNIQD
jgi:hypothetical protein